MPRLKPIRKGRPSVSLHSRLNVALDALRDITLPDECVRLAREEAGTVENRRTFRRTPMLALLASFSRPAWIRALRGNADLRDALAWVLERVAHQLAIAGSRGRVRTADLACRAARRYLLLCALLPELADLDCCEEYVEQLVALPPLGGTPGCGCIPRSLPCISAFQKALRCFRTGTPLLAAQAWSREKVNETFERFDDADRLRGRFASLGSTRWSCLDPLRPVAMSILRDAYAFLAAENPDAGLAANYLIALLCIFHGFDHRDALVLHVGRPDTVGPSPGWLDLACGRLVRRIGSGFFTGDGKFESTEFSLSLVPEIAALATVLGLRMDGRQLRDQLGRKAHIAYGRWLRRRRNVLLPRMKLRSTALHLTFDHVALFSCGLYACELSLLRAAPRYGSDAECSYICANGAELTEWWQGIVGVIRRWAHLPAWSGTVEEPERQHGTSCLTLSQYVETICRRIRGATSRNALLVAIEALFRCLGRRNSLRHENAASCVRGFPEPVLQLVDKWSNGRPLGVRGLPFVPAIEAFVELCAQQCGGGSLVSYHGKNGWCTSDELGDGELSRWLNVGRARQAARTAFFNELRRQRVSAEVLHAAMGHCAEFTWESALLPIPNALLLTQLNDVLGPMLAECGWAEAVAELAAAFRNHRTTPEAVGDLDDKGPGVGLAASPAAPFVPLTAVEDFLACRMLANLPHHPLPGNGWATAVYCSLELGVPFRLIVRNLCYATFRSILHDVATGRVFLFVPIEGPDVGHLDFYPIEIPKNSLVWQHVLRRWEALRTSHRLVRACLDAPLFGGAEIMADRVKKYVSRLASDAGSRLRFADDDAVRLLERISAVLCRHWQPGSAAGALAMEVPAGINQIDIVETISRLTGTRADLRDLSDIPFAGCLFRRAGRPPVAVAERRQCYEAFLELFASARWPEELAGNCQRAAYLYELFQDYRITPARGRYATLAAALGSATEDVSRIACQALELSHRHGALEPTRQEPFPGDEAVREARMLVASRRLDIRHASPREKLRLLEDAARSLEMLLDEGCRLSEAILTLPTERVEAAEWTAHFIPESKTDAGRRMVLPGVFRDGDEAAPQREPAGPWRRERIDPRKNERRLEAWKARLQRQVRRLFDRGIHPHTLRHYRAWMALRAMFRRRERNLAAMLSTVARMFGHASALTFLNSYIGTLLACFAVCPGRLPGLSAVWMRRREASLRVLLPHGSPRLETILRDQYSGRTAARAAITREAKLFASLKHNDPLREGSLECRDLRRESEDLLLRVRLRHPATRVVTLPAVPKLPEYWKALKSIWGRALEAGIPVVFDMPLRVQVAWEEKIAHIARSVGQTEP